MDEIISLARICIALAFMTIASAMDWRTRRVPNKVWIIMGTIGLAFLAYEMLQTNSTGDGFNFSKAHLLIFVPIVILFIEPYREWGVEVKGLDIVTGAMLSIAGLGTLALFYLEGATKEVLVLATIPAMMLFFMICYYTRLIHGGADAKALMALAIVMPFYPVVQGLPVLAYPEQSADLIRMAYPFAFLILMNGGILHVIAYPTIRFFRNLARGDREFPMMLMGYRIDMKDVPKHFVWPLEVVRDGEMAILLFPKRSHDMKGEWESLRKMGLDKVWVQPKSPFIISLTAGLVFSVIVGNIMALLL